MFEFLKVRNIKSAVFENYLVTSREAVLKFVIVRNPTIKFRYSESKTEICPGDLCVAAAAFSGNFH